MTFETALATRDRLIERLKGLPVQVRRLLCVIARQAYHGTLRSKTPGTATMPEIHEACGLDVGELYALLHTLREARFIAVGDTYPFEEVLLIGESPAEASLLRHVVNHCNSHSVPLEQVFVDIQFETLD